MVNLSRCSLLRETHTASKALLAGGVGAGGYLDSAELYQ